MNYIKYLVLFFVIISIISCQNKNNKIEQLKSFYYTRKPSGNFNDFRKIVIINENINNCVNCNRLFAREVEDSILEEGILFIISATGAKIDISPFLDTIPNNIIWDPYFKLDFSRILPESGILYLDKNSNLIKTELNPFTKK